MSPTGVGSRVSATRFTICSWRRRYLIRSLTVTMRRPWRRAKRLRSGMRAISPSIFITSQMTAAG